MVRKPVQLVIVSFFLTSSLLTGCSTLSNLQTSVTKPDQNSQIAQSYDSRVRYRELSPASSSRSSHHNVQPAQARTSPGRRPETVETAQRQGPSSADVQHSELPDWEPDFEPQFVSQNVTGQSRFSYRSSQSTPIAAQTRPVMQTRTGATRRGSRTAHYESQPAQDGWKRSGAVRVSAQEPDPLVPLPDDNKPKPQPGAQSPSDAEMNKQLPTPRDRSGDPVLLPDVGTYSPQYETYPQPLYDSLAGPTSYGADFGNAPCCDGTGPCCVGTNRYWIRGEYLHWKLRGADLPPLVTASPVGTSQEFVGVRGVTGTRTLFGGGDVFDDFRGGGRFTFGKWFDDCQKFGLEASFFFLSEDQFRFRRGSNGNPSLARPFFDAQAQQQASQIVSIPFAGNNQGLAGSVAVSGSSDLSGFDISWRKNWLQCGSCWRFDFLLGYRFMDLDEGIRIGERLYTTNPTSMVPPGTQINVYDTFDTDNRFNGVQLGVVSEKRWGRWSLEGLVKVALGQTTRRVKINGLTTVNVNGSANVLGMDGGLLAQDSNIGDYRDTDFSVIPEVGFNLGYQLTEHLKIFGGYSFIYWTNVVRPGDQIDYTVNPSMIPMAGGQQTGPSRPTFNLVDDDLLVHGANFGLEFTW